MWIDFARSNEASTVQYFGIYFISNELSLSVTSLDISLAIFDVIRKPAFKSGYPKPLEIIVNFVIQFLMVGNQVFK